MYPKPLKNISSSGQLNSAAALRPEVQERQGVVLGAEVLAELVVDGVIVVDIKGPALQPLTLHVGDVLRASVVQRPFGVDVVNTPKLGCWDGVMPTLWSHVPRSTIDLTSRSFMRPPPPPEIVTVLRPPRALIRVGVLARQ
jgi:hypothetical protein